MCNISHIFLDYMDTLLETTHHILVVSMMKTLINSWFYCDCHLMSWLKNYLSIWILENKLINILFIWVSESTHLTHQSVVGWARLQNL